MPLDETATASYARGRWLPSHNGVADRSILGPRPHAESACDCAQLAAHLFDFGPERASSHLRCYTWGNVSQLEKAGREFLAELARQAALLPGADVLAFIGIDSMQKRVYGHHKQGARFGHAKIQGKSLLVRGLNALAAVVSTPLSAPVIAATRLRGGNAASARGAASLAARAIGTARACGCTGLLIVGWTRPAATPPLPARSAAPMRGSPSPCP